MGLLKRTYSTDLELQLYVKVTNGEEEPMTLSVKPSYSIEMIKTQIQSLREIPVKNQILKLNGIELKNEDNLSQHQIENCIVWLSYQPMEISIHIFENLRTKKETIIFEVDWTEKILDLKRKVLTLSEKIIPCSWQNIYLGHGVWNKEAKLKLSDSLADEKIFKQAGKEGLSLMISGNITIHNICENSFNFEVEIEAFETITEVKRKIQVHQQIQEYERKKSKRSKFFDTNTESILYVKVGIRGDHYDILKRLEDDNKTVYDYGIDDFMKKKIILSKNLNPDYEPKKSQILVKRKTKRNEAMTIGQSINEYDTVSQNP